MSRFARPSADELDWGDPVHRESWQAAGLHLWLPLHEAFGQRPTARNLTAGNEMGAHRELMRELRTIGNNSSIEHPHDWRPHRRFTTGLRFQRASAYEGLCLPYTSPTISECTAIVFFTCEGVGAYWELLQVRTNLFALHCSGATGNPLTTGWNGNASAYNAATGLVIPTDGSFCMAAATVDVGSQLLRCHLFTEATPAGSYADVADGTLSAKTLGSTWYVGCDGPTLGGQGWLGIVGEVRFYTRAMSHSELAAIYRDPWDLYRTIESPTVWSPWGDASGAPPVGGGARHRKCREPAMPAACEAAAQPTTVLF